MKLLQNNILFLWWTVVIDWLAQFGVFRWIPKKIFTYIIILLLLTGASYLSRGFFSPPKDLPVNQLEPIVEAIVQATEKVKAEKPRGTQPTG